MEQGCKGLDGFARTVLTHRSMKKTILMICLIAVFAIFTLPVDAAMSRTHEINFDKMVPCVGEVVHLKGPFHVSFTFAGDKSLTSAQASVQGIKGTGESTRSAYSANQNNIMVSSTFKVRSGVSSGQVTVKFEVIGRPEGNANSGNLIRFWAKQIVRFTFGKTLTVDFESLDVCVTP